MEQKHPRAAHEIVKLLSRPRALFFTILAGNTLVNTACSASATMVAISYFGDKGVGIAIGAMLIILLLLGEIIPKTYAYLFAENFARMANRPLKMIIGIMKPVRGVLFFLTDRMINRLGYIVPVDSGEISDEEIKTLVKIGHREGVVEDEQKELIYGVFDFKGQMASDIMTPKVDIKALNFELSKEHVITYTKESKHSRLPVYRDTLDNIVGTVMAKDILFNPDNSLKDVMKEAYFVPESMRIDHLLSDLQKRSMQMSIVTDEYGATIGLVTMEDILEEIVGEIVDEYDKEEPEIVKLNDNQYRISGRLHIDDANRIFKLNIKTKEIDTMSGFAAMILQKIPLEGEEFMYGKYKFRICRVDKRRVTEIILTKI